MRRLFFGLAICGIAALSPAWTLAGDKEIAQQIAGNLKASGQLKGYTIGVKVDNGVATLGGTVRDEQQMASAMYVAQHTPGIDRVVNNLNIVRQNDDSPVVKLRQSFTPANSTKPHASVQRTEY